MTLFQSHAPVVIHLYNQLQGCNNDPPPISFYHPALLGPYKHCACFSLLLGPHPLTSIMYLTSEDLQNSQSHIEEGRPFYLLVSLNHTAWEWNDLLCFPKTVLFQWVSGWAGGPSPVRTWCRGKAFRVPLRGKQAQELWEAWGKGSGVQGISGVGRGLERVEEDGSLPVLGLLGLPPPLKHLKLCLITHTVFNNLIRERGSGSIKVVGWGLHILY